MPGSESLDIGKRLMAHVIDNLAQRDPERKICSIPESSGSSPTYVDFTIESLARAINHMAWWIEREFGKCDTDETLTYVGANDVRYLIVVIACNKTSYKPLLSSTRNSVAAHIRLFEMTNCSKLAYSSEKKKEAGEISSAGTNIKSLEIPSLSDMLSQGSSPLYPFVGSFQEVKDRVAFIAHSSGTTGFPKPIQLTYGYFGALDYGAHVPIPAGRVAGVPDRLSTNDLILSSTPFFHLMGFSLLIMAVFHGIPCVMLPDGPISTNVVTNVLDTTRPTAALFPPSILEDLVANPKSIEALARLNRVYFGGGPLSPEVGRKASEFTQLVSFLGMTEGGFVLSFLPEGGEWDYFEWSSTFGIKMEYVENGLHEMVLHRHENPELQPIFHTFPDLECYHTKDLYMEHPNKPNLWKFHGRLDDVIVFNNGEKFNPVTMEKIIEGDPLVARAVVVGLGRFQTALLIEPNWGKLEGIGPDTDIIDLIWPVVQKSNQISVAHGHVFKEKIILASQDKPFATTPKGSTQRRIVTDDYKEEIEKLYSSSGTEGVPFNLPPSPSLSEIVEYVRNLVLYVSDLTSCENSTDLYNVGFDSLRTIRLVSAFKSKGFKEITPQTIYMNPSIDKIAGLLHDTLNGKKTDAALTRREKIDGLVKKYISDIPQLDGTGTITVALTGSTGSLGSYLLDLLRSDKLVGKVYCLTRDGNEARQQEAFRARGLDDSLPEKIEFVKTSLGEHELGIGNVKYQEMLQSVDVLIHNAWRMDFNISVDSFEEVHIRAARSLVWFSLQSAKRTHIHFLSSIGAIGGWNLFNGSVIPELPFEDCDVALRQGYGEAKHICERIFLAAAQKSRVPISIHRLGQIAGPSTESGYWNIQEWLPALVATSKALGKIPSTLGAFPVDWVPVDLLSRAVLEIVHTRRKTQQENHFAVFHLVNPTPTTWKCLLEPIRTLYAVQVVDMKQWIDDLERISSPTDDDLANKPALKLLQFYRSLVEGEGVLSVPLSLEQAKGASATMRSLAPITPDMMMNWLKQWAF